MGGDIVIYIGRKPLLASALLRQKRPIGSGGNSIRLNSNRFSAFPFSLLSRYSKACPLQIATGRIIIFRLFQFRNPRFLIIGLLAAMSWPPGR